MTKADEVVNAIAGEIVAHPATSRWWPWRLTPQECENALRVYDKGYGRMYIHGSRVAVVIRGAVPWSPLRKHCGRRMAKIKLSECACGRCISYQTWWACTCSSCDNVQST